MKKQLFIALILSISSNFLFAQKDFVSIHAIEWNSKTFRPIDTVSIFTEENFIYKSQNIEVLRFLEKTKSEIVSKGNKDSIEFKGVRWAIVFRFEGKTNTIYVDKSRYLISNGYYFKNVDFFMNSIYDLLKNDLLKSYFPKN